MARSQRAGAAEDKGRPVRDRRKPARSARLASASDGVLVSGRPCVPAPERRRDKEGASQAPLAPLGGEGR